MAPKKRGGGAAAAAEAEAPTAADAAAAGECDRLRRAALAAGLLSTTTLAAADSLEPSAALLRCSGRDIVKKSSNRKNRYLLVFNCLIAPAAAGRLVRARAAAPRRSLAPPTRRPPMDPATPARPSAACQPPALLPARDAPGDPCSRITSLLLSSDRLASPRRLLPLLKSLPRGRACCRSWTPATRSCTWSSRRAG